MKVLDLFSGIGGFSLGLERAGMETVAFCEIEPFCQKVLKKHWPDVPIFNDVRSLDYDGSVDLICGGFPCQPFSVAGKQKGKEDDRHLWPAMFSLIQKYKPSWVIGENVAGLINMGLDDVLVDLESEGYASRSFVIPACAINAPHRRDRVWVVAHANSNSKSDGSIDDKSEYVADTAGVYAQGQHNRQGEGEFRRGSWWEAEPDVGRVADGVSGRVDRLRSLGNAVVPQIPEIIGRAIMDLHMKEKA